MKLSLFFFPIAFFAVLSTVYGQAFKLRGDTLVGEFANDSFGHSVSMNSEGDIIAIGAANNSGNGQGAGSVQVFKWNDTAWVQIGQDIDGDLVGGWFGAAVDINDSGNVLVVGSPYYDGVDNERGMVRVYYWDGTNWSPRGAKIHGPTIEAWAGTSVSVSGDGNTIAYGATRVKGPGNALWTGQVRVYSWNGSSWTLKGSKFDGTNSNAMVGASIDLSYDGNTLAFSASGEFAGSVLGVVHIYHWDGMSWSLQGNTINTGNGGGSINVALSNDSTIAISKPDGGSGNTGEVEVYDYVNNIWQQRGNSLLGDNNMDEFGYSIDLADDGNSLVVGAIAYKRSQFNPIVIGYARAFRWSGSSWDTIGTVYGKPGLKNFGSAVAINKYGNTITVGEKETQNTPSQIAGRAYTFILACTVEASVTDSTPVFIANHIGGSYQWYQCDSSGFTILPGDTSQRFVAPANGQYAVVVRDSNCVDTSACFSAYNVSLPELDGQAFSVYPNPATNSVYLDAPREMIGAEGMVHDFKGELVFRFLIKSEKEQIHLGNLKPGVYVLKVENHQVKLLIY